MGVHKRFNDTGEEAEVSKAKQPVLNVSGARNKSASTIKKSLKREGIQPKRSKQSLKTSMRAIQRLLNNKGSDLNETVRKRKEAELEELKRLKEEHDRREVEKRMAQKYKMVKFFERRGLQRRLDKIVRKGDKVADAEEKKQIMCDLRYICEYPKDKKYISLFPSGGHTKESKRRVEEMRAEIERNANKSAADETLEGDAVKLGEPDRKNEDDFFLNDDTD